MLNEVVISEVGIGICSDERSTIDIATEEDGPAMNDVKSGMRSDVSGNTISLNEGERELTTLLENANVEGDKIATELVTANISVSEGVMGIVIIRVSSTVVVVIGNISTEDIIIGDENRKDGVKILMESVNSEDDIGKSMLFDDIRTTELEG